ncbi:MAG: ATP-binding cassette domain-containing protein [Burkholderiaceae bacterium]
MACDQGSVWLDGTDVTALGADARCRAGIGRTFQIPRLAGGYDGLRTPWSPAPYGAGLHGHRAEHAARDALRRCGLLSVGNQAAGSLGLLQRKRLEVARALATAPRLLLLDEVGGGLTDSEVHELLDLVREIHAQGVTVLWIEHLVHALVSVAQRLVVLTEGALLADGLPGEVINRRSVRETYLGSELDLEAEVADVAS